MSIDDKWVNLKNDSRPAKGGWAPGNYWCRCVSCTTEYAGDKRSVSCADCAYLGDDLVVVKREETILGQPVRQIFDVKTAGEEIEKLRKELEEAYSGWEKMTQEARRIQRRHLDKHEGDVYHAMQTLAVRFGRDHPGPWIERIEDK